MPRYNYAPTDFDEWYYGKTGIKLKEIFVSNGMLSKHGSLLVIEVCDLFIRINKNYTCAAIKFYSSNGFYSKMPWEILIGNIPHMYWDYQSNLYLQEHNKDVFIKNMFLFEIDIIKREIAIAIDKFYHISTTNKIFKDILTQAISNLKI